MDESQPTVILERPDGQPGEIYKYDGSEKIDGREVPIPNPRIRELEYRGFKVVGEREPRKRGGKATYHIKPAWVTNEEELAKLDEERQKKVEAEDKLRPPRKRRSGVTTSKTAGSIPA